MDWLEDDEMLRQWEEVGKEEERITRRKGEGRKLKSGKSTRTGRGTGSCERT